MSKTSEQVPDQPKKTAKDDGEPEPDKECPSCTKKFKTYSSLTKHKLLEHRNIRNVPSKTDTDKRKVVTKRTQKHSGVPANEKVRNAYAALKTKLQQAT